MLLLSRMFLEVIKDVTHSCDFSLPPRSLDLSLAPRSRDLSRDLYLAPRSRDLSRDLSLVPRSRDLSRDFSLTTRSRDLSRDFSLHFLDLVSNRSPELWRRCLCLRSLGDSSFRWCSISTWVSTLVYSFDLLR